MIVLFSSCVPRDSSVNTRSLNIIRKEKVPYLDETLDEVLGQCRLGVLLGAEVLEDVGELLPEVEGFLSRQKVNVWLVSGKRRKCTWYSWWELNSRTSTVFNCWT
jgi:hypothetical protein